MAKKTSKNINPLVDFDLNALHPDTAPRPKVYTRAKGICVVLKDDENKTALGNIINAIRQLKGVAAVKFIDLDAFHDYPNRTRVKIEILEQMEELLDIKEN